MVKVTNKENRTTSLTSLWCLYMFKVTNRDNRTTSMAGVFDKFYSSQK